jgi:hypothetical protein
LGGGCFPIFLPRAGIIPPFPFAGGIPLPLGWVSDLFLDRNGIFNGMMFESIA